MGRRYESEKNVLGKNDELWSNIVKHQNELFLTSKGLPFTYNITILPDGSSGNEIVVSRRSKTITRATVDIAFQKVSQKKSQGQNNWECLVHHICMPFSRKLVRLVRMDKTYIQ